MKISRINNAVIDAWQYGDLTVEMVSKVTGIPYKECSNSIEMHLLIGIEKYNSVEVVREGEIEVLFHSKMNFEK